MKKILPLIIAVLCFTAGAFAHGTGDGKKGMHKAARLAEALELTAEQRQSFDQITQERHKERHLQREQRHAQGDVAPEERRAARAAAHTEFREKLSGILTAEQLARFDEMAAERRERHKRHRDRRGKQYDDQPEKEIL